MCIRDSKKAMLAKELDKARSRISHILSGESNLTLSTLSDIAGVLRCEIEVKFRDKDKRFQPLAEQLRLRPMTVRPMTGIYDDVFEDQYSSSSIDLAG